MSTTQSINDDARRDQAANRATGSRGFMLPLLRKEAKQLFPLLAVLIGCGVFLHLLGLLQQTEGRDFHAAILGLIPVLFAVGVGPLLVSQEKEQRTLRWMASLPIPARSIVMSKLIVSMLALIVCWCISIGIALAFCPSIFAVVDNADMEMIFFLANTFFILMMGFALAWILPNAGSTLVALVFSAIAAWLFALMACEWFSTRYSNADFSYYLVAFQFMVTAILVVAAIGFGKRSFIAKANSGSSASWASRRERSRLAFDRTRTPSLSPASSLIWQVGWQNRMLWVGATFIVLMGLASVAYGTGVLVSLDFLEISPVFGCLVLSWLGASVFGSDASHGRIRFLAERGVAPFKIWWTRLALPLSCVVLGMLVFYLLVETWSLSNHVDDSWQIHAFGGMVVLGVLTTFGFAQWLPQWTGSTLIAFCISPVLAIFSFIYVGFLLGFINAPWWLLVVSIGISFAATRIMLCPWMDGRTGLRYWLSQSALLAGALVVPLIPFLITFATYPDMPAALRRELTKEAKQYEPFTKGIELTIPVAPKRDYMGYGGYEEDGYGGGYGDDEEDGYGGGYDGGYDDDYGDPKSSVKDGGGSDSMPSSDSLVEPADDGDDEIDKTKDEFIEFGDSLSDSLETLERQLQSTSGPMIYSDYWMKAVIKEAQLMSLRIDSAKGEPADLQQKFRERYQRSLTLLSKFAIRMRMSDGLIDQEVSDQIERWLVHELLKPSRKELFSDEEYSGIVAALANKTGRHESRRRAVVVAWYQYGQGETDFGGRPPAQPAASIATSWLVAERNVAQATTALLEYLESESLNFDQFPAEIQSFWPEGAVEFERQFKNIDVSALRSRTPGALWHQDWETKAAKLNDSLK